MFFSHSEVTTYGGIEIYILLLLLLLLEHDLAVGVMSVYPSIRCRLFCSQVNNATPFSMDTMDSLNRNVTSRFTDDISYIDRFSCVKMKLGNCNTVCK